MKKLMLLLMVSLFLFSCGKKYQYIESRQKDKLLGGGTEVTEEDPFVITAKTDSIAYLEAYQRFRISKGIEDNMSKKYNYTVKTLGFKLINEVGDDIAITIDFRNKDSLLKEIDERIAKTVKSSVESTNTEVEKKVTKFDSVTIKRLLPLFTKKKDEFDEDGKVWYTPKSAPKFVNYNGIYCYFQANAGVASNFRLKIQYASDDWLFFKQVKFSIDGDAINYVPIKVDTDNGDGGIWEWSDESLSGIDTAIIRKLSTAKVAKMKLEGRQYYKIKTITPAQLKSIKQTFQLYQAMGGVL